jgi:WD40 repeat protein
MEFARHTTKEVPGYTKAIHDLKWNREGNFLGMVSADKTVKIGQLDRSGQFQNVHSIPNSSQMTQLCWHSTEDSRLAICGDDKNVEIWDVRASRVAMKIPTSGNNINMAWSPSGGHIVVGNRSDILTVIDVRKGTQLSKKKFLYEVRPARLVLCTYAPMLLCTPAPMHICTPPHTRSLSLTHTYTYSLSLGERARLERQ